jgi:hypothetical protein
MIFKSKSTLKNARQEQILRKVSGMITEKFLTRQEKNILQVKCNSLKNFLSDFL